MALTASYQLTLKIHTHGTWDTEVGGPPEPKILTITTDSQNQFLDSLSIYCVQYSNTSSSNKTDLNIILVFTR